MESDETLVRWNDENMKDLEVFFFCYEFLGAFVMEVFGTIWNMEFVVCYELVDFLLVFVF